MSQNGSLESVLHRDRRYGKGAYLFLYAALDYTIKKKGKPVHVSGQELLEGVKELAIQKFGMLARVVFEHWGVCCTDDFGEIVFNLVAEGMLRKTEDDSKEDFQDRYDFKEVFDNAFPGYRGDTAPLP